MANTNSSSQKGNKKVLSAVIATLLVACLAIGGTIAYLSFSQDDAVVNTFVAAGGGNLIDPDADYDPDTETALDTLADDLDPGFFLVETEVEYDSDSSAYVQTDSLVLSNDYDLAMPGMVIAKDPQLTVDIEDGVSAYIYVKVTDTTEGNVTWEISSYWIELVDTADISLNLASNEHLYVYYGSNINYSEPGASGTDLSAVPILEGDTITIKNVDGTTTSFTDTDAATDGMQLGELTFEAYICQSSGFTDATAAYVACFVD